ncbi:porin family protein [Chryseobacterium sp. CBSDS_008]|uniref:porin family protein n=1 Tax=Chryseobacterium sp. CBSDS_008 TaxID=3415265 RepID=UPI003CF7D77B
MKKQFIISLLILSATVPAQKIALAPEAGFGISTVHTNETTGISNASNFNAGVSVRIKLNNNWGIQSGIFYNPKGAQRTISKDNTTINSRRVISYFELPAHLVYYINGENAEGLFVSAGMYLALATGGHTLKTIRGSDMDIEKSTKEIEFGDHVNQVKRFDYGLSFGLGYQSPIGIYIRGQYDLGLQNVVNTKYVYNRSFQLMVGYTIQL